MSSYQGILGLLGTAKFSALAPIHLTRRESWWNFDSWVILGSDRPRITNFCQQPSIIVHFSSSLALKSKSNVYFPLPTSFFQTPKVPTGISYVNLKEPSLARPVESARLQILTPKWMIIGKGKSKLLNNPSALPIARGFITRLLYSKTSANSSGLGSTEDWLFFKAYEIKSF